jgi:hypothetical protein
MLGILQRILLGAPNVTNSGYRELELRSSAGSVTMAARTGWSSVSRGIAVMSARAM